MQVLIIITGNYNFFNLLTLVLTTSLLDDRHLSAEPGLGSHKKMPTSWPKTLLTMLSYMISLVPYSYMEPGIHGQLWTGVRHLFSLWSITAGQLIWPLLSDDWSW